MKQRCAWCGADLGEIPGTPVVEDGTSHGICPACLERPEFRWKRPLGRFLEVLPYPVILVDEAGIRISNRLARIALGPAVPFIMAVEPSLEVEGCGRSDLPGCCTRRVCCSGCVIRKTVAQTFNLGSDQYQVPAVQNMACVDDPALAPFRISTSKVGGTILLQVDTVMFRTNDQAPTSTEAEAWYWRARSG
ncbi:MAG: hypothetical protein IPN59_01240 [Holophaga sp.]|nr:hypothetical protein [Holophaga sp.]